MEQEIVEIKIKKLYPDAVVPQYAHGPAEDAGMDLVAVQDAILRRGVPTRVQTGIAIELPPGFEAQIRSRSGLALKHGIQCINSPGTVDPSYRGDVSAVLVWNGYNPNDEYAGEKLYRVKKGDRIAQMVIGRYEAVTWVEGDLGDSSRGEDGFGSTGK